MNPRRILASSRSCPVRALRIVALVLASIAFGQARAGDPDALWHIVHDQCVPHHARGRAATPCARVDAGRRFAIIKDRRGIAQFLLIPTVRITGIEDPALRAPRATAYWREAWTARRDVSARLSRALDPTEVSLAVNSAYGRSQDQFHIHVDCIAPAVRAVLQAHESEIGTTWMPLAEPLAGHGYRVRRVARLDGSDDPLRLVADGLPGAADDMGREAVFVTAARSRGGSHAGPRGFLVLETRADPRTGNPGSAEELQDHDCAVVRGGA